MRRPALLQFNLKHLVGERVDEVWVAFAVGIEARGAFDLYALCITVVNAAFDFNLGNELLSHTLVCSTIAAGGLNCRVRDGNGCTPSAISHQEIFIIADN